LVISEVLTWAFDEAHGNNLLLHEVGLKGLSCVVNVNVYLLKNNIIKLKRNPGTRFIIYRKPPILQSSSFKIIFTSWTGAVQKKGHEVGKFSTLKSKYTHDGFESIVFIDCL